MADSINLIAEYLTVGHPHTVKLGRGANTEVPVVNVIETAQGIYYLALSSGIPALVYLTEIGTVGKVERWVEVEIAEQGKVTADRYIVLHAVLPVL